jgi:hypothetical protein
MRTLIRKSGSAIGQPVQALIGFSAVLSLTLGPLARLAMGQQSGQQIFASPGEAVEAMVAAAKAADTDALMHFFGPDAKQVISSGDPVADKNRRELVLPNTIKCTGLLKSPTGPLRSTLAPRTGRFPYRRFRKITPGLSTPQPASKKSSIAELVGMNWPPSILSAPWPTLRNSTRGSPTMASPPASTL